MIHDAAWFEQLGLIIIDKMVETYPEREREIRRMPPQIVGFKYEQKVQCSLDNKKLQEEYQELSRLTDEAFAKAH